MFFLIMLMNFCCPCFRYFLLRHLASLVGQDKFIDMLAKYVQQFHGQQVKSQDFIHFFFSTFKDAPAGQGGLQGKISMAEIMNEWLDKPGMPPKLEKFEVSFFPSLFLRSLGEPV